MGKKKHAEHVNHERWLVSYADLLTLLFAFFVVLFASSVSDKKKTAKMAQAMQTAFQQKGIFDAHAETPPLAPGAGTSFGEPRPLELPVETPTGQTGKGPGQGPGSGVAGKAANAQHAMEQSLAPAVQNGLLKMRKDNEGLTLSLYSAGFFPSGSAEIRPAAMPLLLQIAASLPKGMLRVEGHTDNQPIHTEQFRSNWELSTARAAAIAAVLIRESSVPPSNFTLAGYSEFHPVADNSTEEGRAENRRVDIVLLKPRVEMQQPEATGALMQAVTSTASPRQAPSR